MQIGTGEHQGMIGEGQGVDVEQAMAMIEKCQQLGGHFPDADALGRARRMLEGTLTYEEARAEIAAKYGLPLPPRVYRESHP